MLRHVTIAFVAWGLCYLSAQELSLVNICLSLLLTHLVLVGGAACLKMYFKNSKVLLQDRPVDASAAPRVEHDKKRFNTYPFHHRHANTWYHLCDAKEIENGKRSM